MQPAIKDGERILVNRLAYGIAAPFGEKLIFQWATPKKGDVVIYLWNDKIVVKRCVAIGGDKIEILRLDDMESSSMEISADSLYTLRAGSSLVPLSEPQYLSLRGVRAVPDGYILAIGDNFAESVDSRTYGFVANRNVIGRVIGK